MKYIVTILLSINFLFAVPFDMVELYRTKGIKAVEKLINFQLTTQNYWKEKLKNIDVSNGYYESLRYIIICQKNLKEISLYDREKNKMIFSSSVFTGKIDGDKKKEGDLKTPIGAYELTQKLTKLDPFYGPLALTTNYPNSYDKANGKTGHGIWIHGLPKEETRDDFTKGCIALDNDEIKKLDSSINIKNSVLIISEKLLKKGSKDDISIVLSNIFKWKESWKNSDIKNYLSFYDQNFKKANGQNFENFAKFKESLFRKKEEKVIEFSNINVIPYPNDLDKNIYKVTMDEKYKTRNYQFNGKKELYVEIVDSKLKILTES